MFSTSSINKALSFEEGKKRHIEKALQASLEKKVEDAIEFLAPRFNISKEELNRMKRPETSLATKLVYELKYDKIVSIDGKQKEGYNPGRNMISLSYDSYNNYSIIGEEIGHWFHFQINPDKCLGLNPVGIGLKELRGIINLRELVGYYSGLIFSKANKQEIVKPRILFKRARDELFDKAKKRDYYSVVKYLNMLYSHEEGYLRAYKLFSMHGDALLAKLARMSFEDADGFLPRVAPLGYEYFSYYMYKLRQHIKDLI